jgi:4-hydroxy-3-methylbut-2-enyl diphosphate reductase
VKAIAARCDALFVIGAPNSSNSRRLVEVGARAGATHAQLIRQADEIDWAQVDGARTVGLTAGASAPEMLVEEVIAAFRERYDLQVEEVTVTQENVKFRVPRALAS